MGSESFDRPAFLNLPFIVSLEKTFVHYNFWILYIECQTKLTSIPFLLSFISFPNASTENQINK